MPEGGAQPYSPFFPWKPPSSSDPDTTSWARKTNPWADSGAGSEPLLFFELSPSLAPVTTPQLSLLGPGQALQEPITGRVTRLQRLRRSGDGAFSSLCLPSSSPDLHSGLPAHSQAAVASPACPEPWLAFGASEFRNLGLLPAQIKIRL